MYLIDTHTHIYLKEFDSDITEIIKKAKNAGIKKLYLPNIDTQSIEGLHRLSEDYPALCYPMMGLHPTSIGADYQKELEIIRACFDQRKYSAVGEIGIDLYWDKTYLREQIAAFEEQLKWSLTFDLPVAIHTREAFPHVFESLNKIGVDRLRGVFHSFTGNREELEEILKYPNFMIGINGVITYKSAHFRNDLPLAPIERIVLETDAPYLTPVPFRGKRNEPAYLSFIAERLAEIYQLPLNTVIERTTANAQKIFGS